MVNCLKEELISRKSYLESEKIETIYFGGGTPSLLELDELGVILDTIKHHYTITEDAEITLEANPDDMSESSLLEWKKIGVNRLSIGVQSFRQEDLDWMNRAHQSNEAKESILLAKKSGFYNLTVDLIYGLPGLSNKEWEHNINELINLDVPHISSYCLTVEPKTVLDKWVNTNKFIPTTEDTQSEHFLILQTLLEKHGYSQYEVSNFSKPGYESKHNSNYWKGARYLGVGPSAHSFNGASRQWNVANNQSYMKGVEEQESNFEIEELNEKDQFNELILTGLRTIYGVNLERLSSIAEIPDEFRIKVQDFIAKNLMVKKDGMLFLTKEGMLLADYIASELFLI